MPPKSLTEKGGGALSGRLPPAWRSPKVRETSPAVVPNLMRVEEPMSELPEVVPYSGAMRRHVSSDLC